MGASSCPSSGGTLEKRPAGAEQKRKAERIRGTVDENDKNKRMSHVQDEMGRLHHDEQELLCLEGIQDTREARIVRVDAAGGRAESCAVGIATVNVKERLWHWSTCEGRTSLQYEEKYSSNCRQRITRQVTSVL